jgi:hypothetical protein
VGSSPTRPTGHATHYLVRLDKVVSVSHGAAAETARHAFALTIWVQGMAKSRRTVKQHHGDSGAPTSEDQHIVDDLRPGDQYAVIAGLLDPGLPYITFIVEIPVPVATPDLLRVVVPLSGLRMGASSDTEVRIEVSEVQTREVASAATLERLLALPDRSPKSRTLWRQMKSRLQQPSNRTAWVAELTTPNRLTDADQANDSEVAVKLFLRCLFGLNRFLSAYLVASENYSIRPVHMESLDAFALVEFRDRNNRAKSFGGILTLPRATAPDPQPEISEDDLALRVNTCMSHEMVKHPMDRVVTWEKRARYHSWIGGDYEMSIIALMVSAEALITALWRTQQVDLGGDSSTYDNPPRFQPALEQVCRLFGDPWTKGSQGAITTLWRDCYEVRNETVHEGALITHEILDVAFDAYDGLRRWAEKQTLDYAATFPRTALLVHGPRGLAMHPSAFEAVSNTLGDIQRHGELAFWLPPDMPRRL